MKIELRWQLLLVALCVALLISIVGFQAAQNTSQCSIVVAASGGRLIEGIVGQPRYLNPLLSDGNPVDQDLSRLIFDGLLTYDESGILQPSLAESWDVSEDGLSYHFFLRDDITWHDGEPFSAQDVAFSYGLLQDPAFRVPQSLRALWQSVQIKPIGNDQIVFTMPEPFSPFLDATMRGIVPEHLLGDVSPSELPEHPFNSSPVGTGPFFVNPGSSWEKDGYLRLSPNPLWWRGGTMLDGLEYRFFSDSGELVEALETGEVNSAVMLPGQSLNSINQLTTLNLYTSPAYRFTELLFNMAEPKNEAMNDIEVRRALAHGLNRIQLIESSLSGQGLPLEGPFLPNSWAYNPGIIALIEFDVAAAITNLEAAGWTLTDGQSVRSRGETPLTLTLLIHDTELRRSIAKEMIQQWQQVGIDVTVTAVEAVEFRQLLADGEYDIALVDVEPNSDPDLYDFWSQEAIIDGQNYSGWNNRFASEALEEARKTTSIQERQAYYDRFLELFRKDLPSLSLFQHVSTYVLSDEVNAAEVGRIDSPRERYDSFANWHVGSREIPAPCPDEQPT